MMDYFALGKIKNFFFDKVVVYIMITDTPDSLFLCNVSVANSTTKYFSN